MYTETVLVLSLSLLNACFCSSPPLSEKEISQVAPDLQLQYRLPPQSIQPHHTRVGFKHRWVDHAGVCHYSRPYGYSIPVDATTTVSDTALSKACLIVGLMTRHMSTDVFNHVSRGHGLGLFARTEGPGVYPENYKLRDTPQCRGTCSGSCAHTCTFDGRKYDTIAGLTNTRSVVLEDNVLCNSQDPYAHKENVVVHEFAHLVHKFMPQTDQNRLQYIYNYIKQNHVWYQGYGTSNAAEYWAEATSSFFHTVIRPEQDPAVGMNICNLNHLCGSEWENREWLKKHDVWLYNLLAKIYTNNQPTILSGLQVCQ